MREKIKDVFDGIHAEDSLKQRTEALIAEKRKKQGIIRYRPVMAAAICAALILGTLWLYFAPTAYVSIDINPSIELTVNRFDKVLWVQGYNMDGAILADTLDVRFLDVSDGVDQILQSAQVDALLSNDATMVITVAGQAQVQCDRLLRQTQQQTENRGSSHCYTAPQEEMDAAHENGMTCGRYRAYLELQALDPQITPEAVQEMTMDEIREEICRHTDTQTAAEETKGHNGTCDGSGNGSSVDGSNGNGNGNGNGHGDGHGHGKRNHGN